MSLFHWPHGRLASEPRRPARENGRAAMMKTAPPGCRQPPGHLWPMSILVSCVSMLISGCVALTPIGGSDAGPPDSGMVCGDQIPIPSDPCLLGQCGNGLGVGQPCTRGGNECAGYTLGEAIFCSADFSDTSIWFCTKACNEDEDCGADAICEKNPDDPLSAKGCVLQRCTETDD